MKKEYVFLFAAIIILSAYLVLGGRDRTHYELPEIPGVGKKEISKIEIQKKDSRLVLNKVDDGWKIGPENYPADETKVDAMLDVISGLTLTAMVSESKTYDRFDLTDDGKIQVSGFTADDAEIRFDIGKTAGTRQHTFVLIPGDERVYHARGNFRTVFDLDTDGLRNKSVFKFVVEEIHAVVLNKGGDTLALSRQQAGAEENEGDAAQNTEEKNPGFKWVSSTGRPADEAELNRMLSVLSDLKCQKFIYGRPKDDFSDPVYTVTLKGDRDYTLSVYDKQNPDDAGYPATSSENDSPFILPKWKAEKIMIEFEELLKADA